MREDPDSTGCSADMDMAGASKATGAAEVTLTGVILEEATFLEVGATFLGVEATFLEVQPTFLEVKAIFMEVKATVLKVKETFLEVEATFMGVEVTFLAVKATFLKVKEIWVDMEVITIRVTTAKGKGTSVAPTPAMLYSVRVARTQVPVPVGTGFEVVAFPTGEVAAMDSKTNGEFQVQVHKIS